RGEGGRSPAPVLIAAAVIFALALGATRLAGFGAWYLKTGKAPIELEIDASGVTFIDRDERIVVGWHLFRRWFTTPNLLALVAKPDTVAIPRRCCDKADWARLQEIVHNALGSPARW